MENSLCLQDMMLHLNVFMGHKIVTDSVKDNTGQLLC